MSVPKEVIKKTLNDLQNGKNKKEILSWLKENKYIKASNYRNERMNLYRWERKYRISGNSLLANKEYIAKQKRINQIYSSKKKATQRNLEEKRAPFNKTHVYKRILENNAFPKTLQCKVNNVSYSGYKLWLSKGAKIKVPKYDSFLLKAIENIYFKHKGIYGRTKIMITLKEELGLVVSRNTVDRYIKYLGLKAVIRRKKYKKRDKRYFQPFQKYY